MENPIKMDDLVVPHGTPIFWKHPCISYGELGDIPARPVSRDRFPRIQVVIRCYGTPLHLSGQRRGVGSAFFVTGCDHWNVSIGFFPEELIDEMVKHT